VRPSTAHDEFGEDRRAGVAVRLAADVADLRGEPCVGVLALATGLARRPANQQPAPGVRP
jgi:hypothetical protein